MLLVDTVEGRIISDREIKRALYSRNPYQLWLKENQIKLEHLSDPPRQHGTDKDTLVLRQRAFGYTDEDLRMILAPMATKGEEPIGSMGTDMPLACLSDQPQPLFHYFKQLFAQVTNPPIDPIREDMVMSLTSYIGNERNLLDETPLHCHTLKLRAADSHQSRPRKTASRVARRFSGHHAALAVSGGRRRQRPGTGAYAALPARFAGHSIAATRC